MGAAVVDHLDVANPADAFEEFLEILLGDVVGEIPDVNTSGLDTLRVATTRAITARGTLWSLGTLFRLAWLAFFTRLAGCTRLTRLTRLAGWPRLAFSRAGVASVRLRSAISGWKWDGIDLALGPFSPFRPFRSIQPGRRCGFLVETHQFEDLLP
jgi:hypothetical protein